MSSIPPELELAWYDEEGGPILLRHGGCSVVRPRESVRDRTYAEIAKRTPGTVPVS